MKKEQNNSKSITERNSNTNDISLDKKQYFRAGDTIYMQITIPFTIDIDITDNDYDVLKRNIEENTKITIEEYRNMMKKFKKEPSEDPVSNDSEKII